MAENEKALLLLGGYGAAGTILASGFSSHIHTVTASNRLEVERNGSQIKAYANDQLLTSISDSSYTGLSQVGLLVSSYGSPVDVRFDNFLVTCTGDTSSAVATKSSGAGRPPPDTDLPGGWIDGLRYTGK